ncbi:hypothetical protein A2154_04790 [Candidatus Gottesmanbacteria bacterium RBG_16_43_7]|uniref:Uncharacterized protein n=1 Tax=Candidatus Gottesmanbacteria bacterium RBG_16_43_7 TaxID=1798373 RepID=A0A1F5Z8B3_9BACT|nr:MAG: hypothetical protein A2154_04790 [Candidatus Gottesmanbacteria bacterium RBG_16_43_7]
MTDQFNNDDGFNRVTFTEVTPNIYFPETLDLEKGIGFGMHRVNPDNGRLLDRAATVEQPITDLTITEAQIQKAYTIYKALYPTVSSEEFTTRMIYHAVKFLYPHNENLDDLCLTFFVEQQGRLNGLAVNLIQQEGADPDAIISLKMNAPTNVPLGVGTGTNKGLFLYDNPNIRFSGDGKEIIDNKGVLTPLEALLLIVPGRIGNSPERTTSIPLSISDKLGGWDSLVNRSINVLTLSDLQKLQFKSDLTPSPDPHFVKAQWAAVNCPRSGLADEAIRTAIAKKV